jgi:hypothetical protein
MFFTGISAASVYRCKWICIDGINACEQMGMKFLQTANEACEDALGFKSISKNGCIRIAF